MANEGSGNNAQKSTAQSVHRKLENTETVICFVVFFQECLQCLAYKIVILPALTAMLFGCKKKDDAWWRSSGSCKENTHKHLHKHNRFIGPPVEGSCPMPALAKSDSASNWIVQQHQKKTSHETSSNQWIHCWLVDCPVFFLHGDGTEPMTSWWLLKKKRSKSPAWNKVWTSQHEPSCHASFHCPFDMRHAFMDWILEQIAPDMLIPQTSHHQTKPIPDPK